MADSITQQLLKAGYPINEDETKLLFDVSFSGRESTYELLKAANGRFHSRLKSMTPPIDIKRTELLDMLSKTLGHSNHHALKQSFALQPESLNNAPKFVGSGQPLAKLIIHKKEIIQFLKSRGMKIGTLSYSGGKKEIRVHLETDRSDDIGNDLQKKLNSYMNGSDFQKELNSFMKAIGVPMYKNFMVLPVAYSEEDPRPAIELISMYNTFFFPNWKIVSGRLESITPGAILPIVYDKARILAPDMFAIGDLACDMPSKTILNILDTMLNIDGDSTFEVNVIQVLLNIPIADRLHTFSGPGVPMSQLFDIDNREEYLLRKKIAGESADEVARRHSNAVHLFQMEEGMRPYIEHIERHTGKSIGKILRTILDAAIETQLPKVKEGRVVKFDFDGSVDNRAFELCGITHQYLLDRDHDMWHHDMRKTIQYILSGVIEYFDQIQDAVRSIRSI
ncbi:MAG: hypothetical protein PHT07_10445 [Paludibacter sp.]|nr:hypothetical protein [Paludibacter sp.]